jgi:hypothetical protein
VEVSNTFAMSDVTTKQTQIVGMAVLVYTLDEGDRKATCRSASLSREQGRSVLNFVTHRLHGGRLRLDKLPDEQEKRLITL